MLGYQESLDFIHSIARFGSKPGLRRVTMLLDRMGRPQDKLKFIHVAGTDGKGSTCTMLSHIYTAAGYRTGLYISPFVVDFRERIQVCNEMISPEDLAVSTSAVKAHWDALDALGETPTEFEVVVAVAMDHFLRKGCDLVILEVGMGGRFDATNVIGAPLCSVITHISLDHTEYLGDTIDQIAMEKCGIIKPDGVTVCYPLQEQEAMSRIEVTCREQNNPLRIPELPVISASNITGSDILLKDETWGQVSLHVPLAGAHQVANAVTAIEAVKAVALQGFPVSTDQLVAGMEATRFPSRVEVLGQSPLVLLDGGHNPAEAAALAKTLELLEGRTIHAVIGMLADKDVDACLSAVLPLCASLTAVTPDYPRALDGQALAEVGRKYCPDVTVASDTAQGISDAYRRCGVGDVLLACGSLYLAGEMRPILLQFIENGIVKGN